MWMGGPAPNFGRPPHARLPRRRPEWQEVSHSGQHLPCHLAARSPHFWSQWAGHQPPQSWGLILHTHTHSHTNTLTLKCLTCILTLLHTHTHTHTISHSRICTHSISRTHTHTHSLIRTHTISHNINTHTHKSGHKHIHTMNTPSPPHTHTHTGVHCHTGGATRALRPGLDVLVPVLPVPTPGPASKEQITGRRLRSSLTSSRQHSWGRNGVAGPFVSCFRLRRAGSQVGVGFSKYTLCLGNFKAFWRV